MHPKFDPTGIRNHAHDLQIMTVHFMSQWLQERVLIGDSTTTRRRSKNIKTKKTYILVMRTPGWTSDASHSHLQSQCWVSLWFLAWSLLRGTSSWCSVLPGGHAGEHLGRTLRVGRSRDCTHTVLYGRTHGGSVYNLALRASHHHTSSRHWVLGLFGGIYPDFDTDYRLYSDYRIQFYNSDYRLVFCSCVHLRCLDVCHCCCSQAAGKGKQMLAWRWFSRELCRGHSKRYASSYWLLSKVLRSSSAD